MRRTLVLAVSAALALASLALPALAAYPEYEVKAALVVELARFVTWPDDSLGPPEQPFVIGTVGQDPMPAELGAHVHDLKVHGHPVAVRPFDGAAEVGGCHALWVASSERAELDAILARTDGKPILTVSDGPGFRERGVHVTLVPRDGRIGFEVNLTAAERSRLRLSTDMLRLATVVQDGR